MFSCVGFGVSLGLSMTTLRPENQTADAAAAPGGLLGERGSLRRRAASGLLLVLLGHGGTQALRLGSNLILTRLLFPEAFGLIALVQVFLQGLQMFSDVGIRASIVRSPRGSERSFVDTAWTLQVVRGAGLWLVSLAGAVPFASFYGSPQLAGLVPVAGLAAVLSGFESSKIALADRNIRLARTTLLELGSQAISVVAMITWAAVWPTVWALVVGGLVRAAVKMLSSHLLIAGPSNRIHWDRDAARELLGFGRWVFLATLLTFVLQQGDKMVVGKLIDQATLGVYGIAVLWSRMALEVGLKLGGRVMFPALAEVANKRRHLLRSRYLRARLVFLGALLPAAWGLVVFGDPLVSLLYDDRYAGAGWMIRILSVGTCGAIISGMSGSVLLAAGDSFRNMILQVIRGALLLLGMIIGWRSAGLPGLVIGVAVSKVIDYPVVAWAVARHGVWLPAPDLIGFAATAAIAATGFWLLPPEIPW